MPETKKCPFCGEEILEAAIRCKHCRSDLTKSERTARADPSPKEKRPTTYSEVPWYRKNWAVILCYFVLGPVVSIIALTGPIYYEKKGELKTYSIAARVFLVLLGLLWLVVVLFKIYTGAGEAKVSVVCEGAEGGIACAVTHVEGGERVNACWDVILQCSNGVKVEGKACQVVEPEQTTHRLIPDTELKNLEGCDQVKSFEIRNITINEE
jgi:hypothetical protein